MADYRSPALGTPGLPYDPNYDPIFAERARKARETREAAEANLPIADRPIGYVPPTKIQSAAIREIPIPTSAYSRTEELDNIEKAYNESTGPYSRPERGSITAVKVDGRTVFTNQPSPDAERLDYGQETALIRAVGAGQEMVSPYDRDPFGRATSSATLSSKPGGYVFGGGEPLEGGGTDWSKVANPMGFEAFQETPAALIMAQREAELAKAKALTKDPFMIQRLEKESKIGAAEAPYRLQRQYQSDDQAALASMEAELREELKQNPMWMARYRQDPIEGEKDFESRLQTRRENFMRSRGMIRGREEVGGY